MKAAKVIIRSAGACVCAAMLLLLATAYADQPAVPRIGVLILPLADSPYEAGLREGLRERGYVEGKNIIIEWRRSKGSDQELRSLAAELVRSNVDLIVTSGSPAARAALAATKTIPVVFSAGDPVATGLAASLARPGGNGTGISAVSTELTAKRLDFLHQLAPRARRIAYLTNSSNPIGPLQLEEAQKAARTLGVKLITLDARNEAELDAALRALSRNAADAILVTVDLVFLVNKSKIARAVRQTRLPGMFPYREFLEGGTLASYGLNLKEVGRKLAVYVDKILKGAKPADLPIEEISKYELVIDLRAARELGIKVPQELLYRAEEVIR